MSPDFEFWKLAYEQNWADAAMLQEAVTLGSITQDEYNSITAGDETVPA